MVENYGDTAQNKWAAWRRKEGFEEISSDSLDDQMALVAEFLDPVFAHAPDPSG